MSTDARIDEIRLRTLLQDLISRVHSGQPIADLLSSDLGAERVAQQLLPLGSANAVIASIAGTAERVDSVVTAAQAEWRVVFGTTAGDRITWLEVYTRPQRFDGIAGGRVIVLNGPSGAGKSTLMRALQSAAGFPLVVLDEPENIGTVQQSYLIWRDSAPSLHRGYLVAAAALARAGNHVALSAAGHPQHEIAEAFGGIAPVTVGLSCEFGVLVERERRTGRWAGIAAASVEVHDGWTYDLQFDTTDSPDMRDMAGLVLARVSASGASAGASDGVSGTL